MGKTKKEIHPSIRAIFGFKPEKPSSEILALLARKSKTICKPCWEIKYCPYGPLVEDFPLPPPTLAEAIDHQKYLAGCLKSGLMGNGKKLDKERRKYFEREIRDFNSVNYPDYIPKEVSNMSCRVFGHLCPVFFVAETATETKEARRFSRRIPREVMLKVVRRDSQICQDCGELVKDNEVEFDHIIPFSKGGTSTVENLRLVHRSCNRRRSNKVEELLHSNPFEHDIQPLGKKSKK
jgi:hypothetical protein